MNAVIDDQISYFEMARLGMSMIGSEICAAMDLSDEEFIRLRDNLQKYLGDKVPMKKFDVTIKAMVTKTIRVEAEDEEDAIVEAFEAFSVRSGDMPEKYIEDVESCKEVTNT
jgi:hypothetical protein